MILLSRVKMEFWLLTIVALLSVVTIGSNASSPAEEYWHSKLPNTPVPQDLQNFLQSDMGGNITFWDMGYPHETSLNTDEDVDDRRRRYGYHHRRYRYDHENIDEEDPNNTLEDEEVDDRRRRYGYHHRRYRYDQENTVEEDPNNTLEEKDADDRRRRYKYHHRRYRYHHRRYKYDNEDNLEEDPNNSLEEEKDVDDRRNGYHHRRYRYYHRRYKYDNEDNAEEDPNNSLKEEDLENDLKKDSENAFDENPENTNMESLENALEEDSDARKRYRYPSHKRYRYPPPHKKRYRYPPPPHKKRYRYPPPPHKRRYRYPPPPHKKRYRYGYENGLGEDSMNPLEEYFETALEEDLNNNRRRSYGRRYRYADENALEEDPDDSKLVPNTTIFFRLDDLHAGKKFNTHISKSANKARILPRQVAETIPFTETKIPEALKLFSLEPTSPQTKFIKENIGECESPGIKGEDKLCATSLESIVDFSVENVGHNVQVYLNEIDKPTKPQEYTIMDVKLIGEKQIVCHKLFYPYGVHYCHTLIGTKVYNTDMVGEDGTKAKAVIICHSDTSQWDPNHFAFKETNMKPGEGTICHFIRSDTFVVISQDKISTWANILNAVV